MNELLRLPAEARPIVQAAAVVYVKHTTPWLIGLIVHGSGVKGGYIPGCSDIDFQLYLNEEVFTSSGQLRLALALEIHRDLSRIDPSPFRYLQCGAWPHQLLKAQLGPIPGAYCLLAGRLPIAEATREQLQTSARQALSDLNSVPAFITSGLLDHGGGRLAAHIRLLCTKVWPMLYHVLTLQHEDAIHVWNLTKAQAIQCLPAHSPLRQTIDEFYAAVWHYYPAEKSFEDGLTVIQKGVAFLEAAKTWWASGGETRFCDA